MSRFLHESELENHLSVWMESVREFSPRFRRLEPEHAALLVIDMQNEFLAEDGLLPTWGGPAVLPRVSRLMESFRRRNRPVIYTRHCYFNPSVDGGTTAEWWGMKDDSPILNAALPSSAIHKSIAPKEGETVIAKHRYSAFHATNLESILRNQGVRDVAICGVATNCCCEATAHDALFRDFHIFFLADGCGASDDAAHIATLRDIACFYGTVLTCKELADALES